MRNNKLYKGICAIVSILLIALSIYLFSTVSLRREVENSDRVKGMDMNESNAITYDNIDEFSKQLGIEVKELEDIPFEVTDTIYTSYSSGNYKIEYSGDDSKITFYRARKFESISFEASRNSETDDDIQSNSNTGKKTDAKIDENTNTNAKAEIDKNSDVKTDAKIDENMDIESEVGEGMDREADNKNNSSSRTEGEMKKAGDVEVRYIEKDDYTLVIWKSDDGYYYGIKSEPAMEYDEMEKMIS